MNEDAIESIKRYLEETKKPTSMKVENYTRRVKMLNNYIPLMEIGAIKLTERELIKQVVLKGTLIKWTLNLKRANNHNLASLAALQSLLKPIEEADDSEQKHKNKLKSNQKGDC